MAKLFFLDLKGCVIQLREMQKCHFKFEKEPFFGLNVFEILTEIYSSFIAVFTINKNDHSKLAK